MKALRKFFDWPRFSQGKEFEIVGIKEWLDYQTKNRLGYEVEVVITEDRTKYPPSYNGQPVTNKYGSMKWRTAAPVNLAIGTTVVPVGVKDTTINGDYSEKLTLVVSDIKPAQAAAPAAPTPPGTGKALH